MKKIFFIVGTLEDGGQEKQLYNLLEQIKKHEKILLPGVIVWSYNPDHKYAKILKNSKISVFGLNKNDSFIKKVKAIRKVVKEFKPNSIQSFALYLNFPLFLSCINTKTVTIGGLRSGYWSGFKLSNIIPRLLAGFLPLRKISNNEKGATELKKLYKLILLDPENIQVVRNKLDLEKFYGSSERYLLNHKQLKTVSIGTLSKVKRWDLTIEVIYRLKKMGHKITHYHAGDGALRNEIEAIIIDKGLEDNFILIGRVQDIPKFLSDAYLLIHSADSEGSSNVIMEAVSCGIPIISTRCGDIEYLVKDGENGFISEIGDVKGLTGNADKILASPKLATKMSVAGTQHAQTNFTIESYVPELLSVYKKINVI